MLVTKSDPDCRAAQQQRASQRQSQVQISVHERNRKQSPDAGQMIFLELEEADGGPTFVTQWKSPG
jgi:hypothetical protein